MKTPPAMQALVEASKLNLTENTSGEFDCPKCGGTFIAYRTASGKLMGKCECGLNIPRA